MRPGKINGPLTNDRIEKSFHEFGQVHHRKVTGYFAVFLTFGDNFAEKIHRCRFCSAQLRRAHRVHGAGENHGLPKRAADFGHVAQSFVKAAQALLRGGFGGEFRLQAFGLAGESAAADFAQDCFFAGEITEESGLADFQSLHDVVNARFFIAALAKKMQGRFDDLLAQARFLAFAQAADWFFARARVAAFTGGVAVAIVVDCGRRHGWLSGGNFCARHNAVPPAPCTGAGCANYIVIVALTL